MPYYATPCYLVLHAGCYPEKTSHHPSDNEQNESKAPLSFPISSDIGKRKLKVKKTSSKDPQQRLRQLQSLATALTAAGAEFTPGLVYSSPRAPRRSNNPAKEMCGMQVRAHHPG